MKTSIGLVVALLQLVVSVAIAAALWFRKLPSTEQQVPIVHVHVPQPEQPSAPVDRVHAPAAVSPAPSATLSTSSGMAYIMKRDGEDWIPHRLRAFGSREDETTWDADLVMALDHPGLGIRWPDEREVQTCRKNT